MLGATGAGAAPKVPAAKVPAPAPVKATEEALSGAIEKHDLALATKILAANPKLATQGEVPPLHQCASENEVPIARLLIARGAKWDAPVDAKTESGATALHFAVQQGAMEMTQFLLANGATLDAGQNDDITPLQSALQHGKFAMAKWLLEKGAKPDALDYNKQSALFYAVANPGKNGEGVAFVKALLARGANANTLNFAQETPLYVAVEDDDVPMISALLAGGAKVESRNRDGETALQSAIKNSHFSAAGAMIDRAKLDLVDADSNTVFDSLLKIAGDADESKPQWTLVAGLIKTMIAKAAPRKNFGDGTLATSVSYWLDNAHPALAGATIALLPDSPAKNELNGKIELAVAKAAVAGGTLTSEAAYRTGLSLQKGGNKLAALEMFGLAAQKLAADAPPAQVEGIYSAMFGAQKGDAKAQEATLDAFVQKSPKSAQARVLRGRLRSDNGDYLRAIDDWNSALTNAPTDPSVPDWHFQRGYCFTKLEKWPLALTEYNAADKGGLDTEDLWNNRGYVKSKSGDSDGAKADYVRVVQKHPLAFDAELNLADLVRDGGKTDEALAAYITLTEQTKTHPEASTDFQKSQAFSRVGEIYARAKRDADAIPFFQTSIGFHADAAALCSLADIFNYNQRNAEALDLAKRAALLDSKSGGPWYEQALALVLLDRPDEALDAANKGIEVAPEEAQIYLVRANIYAQKGRTEEANRDTEKAKQLNAR